jgi:DNA-binding beta-propeller fold protein YncE
MKNKFPLVLAGFFALIPNSYAAVTRLKGDAPIAIDGKNGAFDFMAFDSENSRILAAHRGAGTLMVFDSKTGKILSSVPTGAAQGVAVDSKGARYFVGDKAEKKVVMVDSKSLAVTGEVEVTGPVDAITFDSKRGLIYADEDDGTHIWVIDPTSKKIVATIEIPGAPEVIEYDSKTDRIYQNIKTKDVIVVIDPNTRKIVATWSTLPATGPHGLVIDTERGRLFSAGKNGKLVSINVKDGKVSAVATIPESPDQIAFDSKTRMVFSACRGYLSIVRETESGVEVVDQISTPKGAHTLAVDSKSGAVWLSYADEKISYLVRFH